MKVSRRFGQVLREDGSGPGGAAVVRLSRQNQAMRRRKAGRILAVSGTMLMLMTGCGGWQDGKDLAQAKERTRDDAWQQTRDVQRMIEYDHADRADLFIRSAGRVKGVEVMQVSGSTPDTGDGVVLVIRVHGRTPIVDSWNRRTGEQLVLPHCFRLVYDRTVRDEPVGAAHPADLVECPTTAPLSISASPELPAGAR